MAVNRQRIRIFMSGIVAISMVGLIAKISITQSHLQQLANGEYSHIQEALRQFQQSSSHPGSRSLSRNGNREEAQNAAERGPTDARNAEAARGLARTNQDSDSEHTVLTYPLENPIPNPDPMSGYDSFSACLLVMDDNHRLIEWLAYHYHVLPLRYMIVAVDPRSRTSPTFILNRFRRMGMYIEEWTDHDFLDPKLASSTISDDARFQVKRDRHRARQKVFYRSCLIQMEAANRTYVTLHDTDEYLVYNWPGGDQFDAWEQRQQQKHDQSRNKNKARIKPVNTPPSTAEAGAMLSYIRKEKAAGHPFFENPCISCPRLHFGAVESTRVERSKTVPKGFDAEMFDTFRWRKHSERNDFIKNNLSKVIIDVSGVNMTKIPRFQSLHRPIPTICRAPWVNDWESALRINHYLGSWESFSFRNDARRGGERSRESWEFQAADQDETDDNVRPWLDGMVKEHGHDTVLSLLENVGLPKFYRNSNEDAWKSIWVDEILSSNTTDGTNPKNHEFADFIRQRYLNMSPSADGTTTAEKSSD